MNKRDMLLTALPMHNLVMWTSKRKTVASAHGLVLGANIQSGHASHGPLAITLYGRHTLFALLCRLLAACLEMMCFTPSVQAADMHFQFSHIEGRNLPGTTHTYSVIEGADGAIWFGTRGGVNRFNGNTTLHYDLWQAQKYSGYSGRVVRLCNGHEGQTYAYDNKGNIYVYNQYADSFALHLNIKQTLAPDVIVNHMLPMPHGSVLLALNRGVCLLSAKGAARRFVPNVFATCLATSGNNVLVGSEQGLFVVNLTTGRTTQAVKSLHVQSLYVDHARQSVWVGTFNQGLRIYALHTWGEQTPTALYAIPRLPVRVIRTYRGKTMLVGIDGAGVYAVSDGAQSVQMRFNADSNPVPSLSGNGVYDICIDREGNVWTATYAGGLDLAVPTFQMVSTITHEQGNPNSLFNNSVNAVCQTSDGCIWYATDQGVSRYNPQLNTWQHMLYGKVVLTLCTNGSHGVLAGTYGSGVYAVSAEGNTRQTYAVAMHNLASDLVYSLFRDAEGELWIGCLDGKLTHVGAKGTTHYPITQVQTIVNAPQGRVAVGTSNGFFVVDKASKKSTHHFYAALFNGRDVNTYLQHIIVKGNEAWLATDGGGLYRYNMRTRHLQQITTNSGLPSNTVHALAADTHGRIFAATDQGLAMIAPNSRLRAINLNFVKAFEREYKRAATTQLADGRIAFGSSEGAVIVDGRHIERLNYHTNLRIRRIVPTNADDQTIAHVARMLAEGHVRLPHNDNALSINFESINYKYRHDILYRYRMEGLDKVWSEASQRQTAQYTNLPAGQFRFVVQAVSRNDGRVLASDEVPISIAQPWWNTPLARLVYLLLAASLVYLVWMFFRNRLRQRYVDEKISFFVNTAHDIRTPLSLVLAPLDDLWENASLAPAARENLATARNNAHNLRDVVNRLLDFQQWDSTEAQPALQRFELRELLQRQVEKFAPLANAKHIGLQLTHCPDAEDVLLDADMADRIFENILSNALKYTPEGGNVTLQAHVADNNLHIDIADTGIGIPQQAQQHIFKDFYRAENAVNSQQAGSGLGLMLTRRLVQKHHGQLTFDSTEGQGTRLRITLPRPAETTSPTPNSTHTDTLLFVDDNEALRQYMRTALGRHYNVATASSAYEALAYLQNQRCDIIVSDVMMPGMSGDLLCHEIKQNEQTAWLPVILLTAKAGRDFTMAGLRMGADDYVAKPFDMGVLRSKIDSMLANRRRLRAYYMQTLVGVARNETPAQKVAENPANPADTAFVEKATQLVVQNMADTDFGIDQLCREMAMSRTLFFGRLKALTGKAPQDFIRLIRLERAAQLIRQGKSVADVSVATGFVNAKYFSTLFKKHFGVSPSKFS